MKSITLLTNARRRRKSRSRRRTRRNPTASYRRNYDRIFKRTKRRRTRGVRRARRLSIRKYSLPGNRQGLAVRARRIYVSRRGRKSALIVARNPRRRRSRMNPMIPSLGGITSQVKGLFSKENLTIAGGGVLSTVVTQYALNLKDSAGKSILPMPADANMAKVASVAYAVGIPFTAALLTRKFSPGAAKGMIFGGLINGIMTAWKAWGGSSFATVTGTAPVSEYLRYTPTSAVGANPPSYMAATQFARTAPMNGALSNSSAFGEAWGGN